ncbi:MAG: fumarylacetoacetate hydrolase family protein [Actinobacteria bacterium]|nr:fumarylacetoacetate hydrolase family protein [Actinomycetota bacterium]
MSRIACLDGEPSLLEGTGGHRLTSLLPPLSPTATAAERMLALVRHWPDVRAALDGGGALPEVDPERAAWSAPLPRPGKIVAAPVNYRAHAAEMGAEHTIEQQGIFLKANSSVIGPGGTIVLPYPDRRTDQEGELAVIVGRRARHVGVDQALDAVLGYTCLVDVTLRGPEDRSGRKSFDTFTPMGPWITTADEVPDPDALLIRCWVNGDLRQEASTADLIFGVARLLSYVSHVMTLEPGDVVSTGTPAGVGPLAPGDRVTVEIDRVGRLEVGVEAGPAAG